MVELIELILGTCMIIIIWREILEPLLWALFRIASFIPFRQILNYNSEPSNPEIRYLLIILNISFNLIFRINIIVNFLNMEIISDMESYFVPPTIPRKDFEKRNNNIIIVKFFEITIISCSFFFKKKQ